LRKIVSTQTTSAIFLAIVLITGTFTAVSQFFITTVNAQSESYYETDEYTKYGMDMINDYVDEYEPSSSYSDYDNKYQKSKNTELIKKIKCNNINANLNGVNVETATSEELGSLGLGAAAFQDDGEISANEYGYDRQKKNNGNFNLDCINNNDNAGQGGGGGGTQGPPGPRGPPGADGEDGDIGPQGPAGFNGTNGIDGKDGINGTNGIDGKDGINGTNGRDGVNGTNAAADAELQCEECIKYWSNTLNQGQFRNFINVMSELINSINFNFEADPTPPNDPEGDDCDDRSDGPPINSAADCLPIAANNAEQFLAQVYELCEQFELALQFIVTQDSRYPNIDTIEEAFEDVFAPEFLELLQGGGPNCSSQECRTAIGLLECLADRVIPLLVAEESELIVEPNSNQIQPNQMTESIPQQQITTQQDQNSVIQMIDPTIRPQMTDPTVQPNQMTDPTVQPNQMTDPTIQQGPNKQLPIDDQEKMLVQQFEDLKEQLLLEQDK
jgi:hypothetical protein